MKAAAQRLAIVGGGWSGMAAAVEAVLAGHQVTVFEAGRSLGGRARALRCTLPDGTACTLDNGQHILIGAYSETLRLMQQVGIDLDQALLRMPLRLQFPDGAGLQLPDWPAPLDALAGIATARGWSLADKASLLRQALRWRLARFRCPDNASVADQCSGLTTRVIAELIDPLCVSALNIAPNQASGRVFLRVLHDAMFGTRGASNLLLPRVDLASLFPEPASRWITRHGARVCLGARVLAVPSRTAAWRVGDAEFDQVLVATGIADAVRLVESAACGLPGAARSQALAWTQQAAALRSTAITTVYAWGAGVTLGQPMLALRSTDACAITCPAQFVFDRGQLGGPTGLLAFVASASSTDRGAIQHQVLSQATQQLGLELTPVQSVVEKRATFACVPGLHRPGAQIAPGLRACGDYLEGPYPATLEAAVRSGVAAIRS